VPLRRVADEHTADDIAVAAEVFGRRMHDQVAAELQRQLQERRRERVVGERQDAALPADGGDRREVVDAQQRIGGALEQHEPRVLAQRLL
jgi:hypothetical protein